MEQVFDMRTGSIHLQLFRVMLLCGFQMLYGFSNLVVCLHEGTSSSLILAVTDSSQESSCEDHHCADSEKPSEASEHHHACEDLVFQAPLSPCPRAEQLPLLLEGNHDFFSLSDYLWNLYCQAAERFYLRISSGPPGPSAPRYCDHVCFRC